MNSKRIKAAILTAVMSISALGVTASALSSEFDYAFNLSVGGTAVEQARKKTTNNYVTVKTTEGTVTSNHPVSVWVSPTTTISNKITNTKTVTEVGEYKKVTLDYTDTPEYEDEVFLAAQGGYYVVTLSGHWTP